MLETVLSHLNMLIIDDWTKKRSGHTATIYLQDY